MWTGSWLLPPAPPPLDLAFEPLDLALAGGRRLVADGRNNGVIVLAADGAIEAFWPASAAVTAGAGRPRALVRALTLLRPEVAGAPAPLADSAVAVLWQRFIETADNPGQLAERAVLEIRGLDGRVRWTGLLPEVVRGAKDLAFRAVNPELFILADAAIWRLAPLADDGNLLTGFGVLGQTPVSASGASPSRLGVLRDGHLALVRSSGIDLLDWSGLTLQQLELGGATPLDIALDARGEIDVLVRPTPSADDPTTMGPLVMRFDNGGAPRAAWSADELGVPLPSGLEWRWSIASDGGHLALTSGITRFGVYAGDPASALAERLGAPRRNPPSDAEALASPGTVAERPVRLAQEADGRWDVLDPASGGVYRVEGDHLGPRFPVPLDSVDLALGPEGELYVLTAGGQLRAYPTLETEDADRSADFEPRWSRMVDQAQWPQLLQGGWSSVAVLGDELLVGLPADRRIAVFDRLRGTLSYLITAGELESQWPKAEGRPALDTAGWAYWPVDLAVERLGYRRERAWAGDTQSGWLVGFDSDASRSSVNGLASHMAGLVAPPLRLAASLPSARQGRTTRLAVLLADGTVQVLDSETGILEIFDRPRRKDGGPVIASDIDWTAEGQLLLADNRSPWRAIQQYGISRKPATGLVPTGPRPSSVGGRSDQAKSGASRRESSPPSGGTALAAHPSDRQGTGDLAANLWPSMLTPRISTRTTGHLSETMGGRRWGPQKAESCTLAGKAELGAAELVEGDSTTARLVLWTTCSEGWASGADIVFAVDRSGSMAGAPLSAASDAVASVIALLGGGEDRVALLGFNENGHVVVPLTRDNHAVVSGLNGLLPEGGTNLLDALTKADLHLQHEGRAAARPVVVLLTDGGHNEGGDELRLIRAAEALRNRGAAVLVVGLGSGVDEALLAGLADRPEHVLTAASPRALAQLAWPLAAEIAATIPGQLLIDATWPGAVGGRIADRSQNPRGLASTDRALWSRLALPAGQTELGFGLVAQSPVASPAPSFARVSYVDGDGGYQVLDVPAPAFVVHSKLDKPDQVEDRTQRIYLPTASSTSCHRAPRTDIALVLDGSLSMDEPFGPGSGLTKREGVWRQASQFVDQLALGEQRAALVVFHAEAQSLQLLTTDASALRAALARPIARTDASRLDFALQAAGVVLDVPRRLDWVSLDDPWSPGAVGRTIVLVSDGRPVPDAFSDDAFNAADSLRQRGVKIVSLGLGPQPNAYLLRQLAGPRGDYWPAPDETALAAAFGTVARRLACPVR